MKQQCVYHPTRTAHWSCPKCNKAFCPECIVKRGKAGYSKNDFLHFCPKCNGVVSWVGVANIIEPFWLRLPKIFTYPFAVGPLALIMTVTILSMLFSGPGLTNSLIGFAIWGIMVKYSFAALQKTATGALRPPAVSTEVLSSNFEEVFKQLLIFLFIGGVFIFVSGRLGPLFGLIVLLFMLISVPAMIIVLVSSQNFFQAVNPVFFGSLIFRIGWGYPVMCLFLLFLSGAPAMIFQMTAHMLPDKLGEFIAVFAENFYTLISYHLMGYVVLQYHEEIGYTVEHKEFDDPTEMREHEIPDPEERLLQEVTLLAQEGNLTGAVKSIEQHMDNCAISGRLLADRYFELLKLTGRTDKMMDFGKRYLDLLAGENDKRACISAYTLCKSVKPDFEPDSAALMKIAGWVGESGKPESAIQLYTQLITNHPKHPVAPRACFRAAQVFNDRLMKPERCREALHILIKNYPDSDVVPMAKRYLDAM